MTVTWIAVASIAATLLTLAVAFALYLLEENRGIYPANYHERQIPAIEQYVRQVNTELLSKEREEDLSGVIGDQGIRYQVVDGQGKFLYGTETNPVLSSRGDLIRHLNITSIYQEKNKYLSLIPLLGEDGEIQGAVALVYQVKMFPVNSRGSWVSVLLNGAFFSPIVYIVLFTMYFSRRFIRRINQPLQLLQEAAEKIKKRDLDFQINYHADNELGQLCKAFSEMQEELRKSLSAQWKMEQERIEMVDALAHDIKTPASIILAYTESLLDHPHMDPDQSRRYLSVIERNAKKCTRLARQMKEASESEQAGSKAEYVRMNLYSFLEQKVREYRLQAKEKRIEIQLCDDKSLHASYTLDRNKLDRIFDNILSNSLSYTPAGGYIRIRAFADGEVIRYQLSDTGSGFAGRDLEHATERFYRGDEGRHSGDGHSGLGLYTVKQLVSQMGGELDLSNEEDGGACVRFSQRICSDSDDV